MSSGYLELCFGKAREKFLLSSNVNLKEMQRYIKFITMSWWLTIFSVVYTYLIPLHVSVVYHCCIGQ